MYICMCHGYTDKQVRKAIGDEPCRVACVWSRLGARPKCGKCVQHIHSMVKEREPTHSPHHE